MNSKIIRLISINILKARAKRLRARLSVKLINIGLLKEVNSRNNPYLSRIRGQIKVGETPCQILRYLEMSKKGVIFYSIAVGTSLIALGKEVHL